jgi:hypothetical protein
MSVKGEDEMAERDEDRVDGLLREARFEAPMGLAARLARGALAPDAAGRIFWLDFERVAGRVARIAVAAAVLAVALAIGLVRGRATDGGAVAQASGLDDVAQLALSPASFEWRLERDGALLPPTPGAPEGKR